MRTSQKIEKHHAQRASKWVMVFLLVSLIALLTGCSSATRNIKKPHKVMERFSETGEATLPDKWWLSFNDQVLNDLIENALSNNFDLKTAWDRLNQAKALVKVKNAGLFPTLNAEAGSSVTQVSEKGQTNNFSFGLAASYEVDLWGRVASASEAALFSAKASQQDLKAAALTVSANVATTWYQLVEQYGQLDLLRAQTQTNEKTLQLVTLQFRTGQVGIADMLQQRQLVESKQGEIELTSAKARVLEHKLAILLGYPPNKKVAPRVSVLGALPPMPNTGLPAELIQKRPDILSAYYAIKSADSNMAVAIANQFPRLSLTANLKTTEESVSDLFDNWLGTLAANLVAPIIDGGSRKAEVERNQAVVSEKLHSYAQKVNNAFGEVEDALVQEKRQQEYIKSLNKQLDLANQVIAGLKDRYLKGAVDYQRVLDALISQQKLQQTLLTARRNLRENRINLCRYLGGGWTLNPARSSES